MPEPSNLDKFIMNILNRRGWVIWPSRIAVINRVKRIIFIGKRKRVFFTCEECGNDQLTAKDIEVDHIEPRIDPVKGFQGIEDWILRTFVGTNKLKLLCKSCHRVKSELENEIRRLQREKDSTGIPKNKRWVGKVSKAAPRKRAKVVRK
jgi:5-methylcytosine-specific restriction endonuclease McrA